MADWYQLFLDDLPIWGMVGEMAAPEVPEGSPAPADGEGEPLVYTHKKFMVAYNGNRIIQVPQRVSESAWRCPRRASSLCIVLSGEPYERRPCGHR